MPTAVRRACKSRFARLRYESPRVRESPRGKERQAGRGSGEAGLELDRRKIRDRIAELKEQLEAIQKEYSVRRAQRQQARRVALVGYTNAGKSSLMRALTGSDVYVENKLFATLDTTVRALAPEVEPRILISDTVGFIKKLPHDLVASFKSTLDEASEASLLLHVVDASDPSWQAQLAVTREVLTEIGAHAVPSRLVMNKVDCLAEEALLTLRNEQPEAWFLSAKAPGGRRRPQAEDHRLLRVELRARRGARALQRAAFARGNACDDERARYTLRRGGGIRGCALRGRGFGDRLGARLPEGAVTLLDAQGNHP